MIRWLIQTCDDVPHHFGWLNAAELARCASFKSEKRRYDWLLGRWTGKQLVRSVVGEHLALSSISILSRMDGSPVVTVEGQPLFTLSVSHAHDRALCALVDAGRLGADIEAVEPRIPVFAEDYFTAAEQALVQRAAERDALITAIWSAKEAALKALCLGLTVDTRAVECRIEPGTPFDWTPFAVSIDGARLKCAASLNGWWHRVDGFVLTLVSEAQPPDSQYRRVLP